MPVSISQHVIIQRLSSFFTGSPCILPVWDPGSPSGLALRCLEQFGGSAFPPGIFSTIRWLKVSIILWNNKQIFTCSHYQQNGVRLTNGIDTVSVDVSEKSSRLQEYSCRLYPSLKVAEGLHSSMVIHLSMFEGKCH